MRPTGAFVLPVLFALSAVGFGQPGVPEAPLPPPERTPQLVINHDGPHAPILSLAFAPDGTLYAGGYGKIVHRYTQKDGRFAPAEPIRVPLGPGNAGAVNAVGVSPDGKWVAVAGRAPLRGESRAGADDGVTVKTQFFPPLLKRDYGVVYLFNPADPQGGKVIRGPESGVRAVAFADPSPATGPVLVTAGVEWDADGKQFGAVRVFDVASGKELAARKDLPPTPTRPGLAAWGSGKTVRVAVAWPKADNTAGELIVWDTAANKDDPFDDGRANVALAVKVGPKGAERIVSGGMVNTGGRIALRPADPPAVGQLLALRGGPGQVCIPLSVTPVGDNLAALVQVHPPPPGTAGRPVELWLLTPNGATLGRVVLTGVDNSVTLPTVVASADGKQIAVGGFADHRIEVYDAAQLAANRATVQTLRGTPGGYSRVAFLAAGKLWLGGPADTAPRGGVVFDPAARAIVAGGDRNEIDQPAGSGPVAWTEAVSKDGIVSVTTARTGNVTFPLLKDEKPTAVAYLPAAPAWDKQLPAVLAVAHYNPQAAVALVTLFDATDGRRLVQLAGPTLRIEGLAFSGTRPLLAAVGDDRAVSVWTLKDLRTPLPAVDGVTLFERDAELVVAAVEPDSPARNLLRADAVIEAVGGENGELKAVKTYREFLLAVREVGVGKNARVRLKGAAQPVLVPVGRGVGHRRPLFDLWVNPVANKDNTHDWIGWTPAGPYDANSVAAEGRLGWLHTTGNPAEPVRYAGVEQYRRLYYKSDILRFLLDEADFDGAIRKYAAVHPRTQPTLVVRTPGLEQRDGRDLVRTPPKELVVTVDDPARLLLFGKAVLRWRANGQEWQSLPAGSGRLAIPLDGHAWKRGTHRFEVAFHETPDLPPAVRGSAAFAYVPPAPTLTVQVDGGGVSTGDALTTAKPTVEVVAKVTAAAGEEVDLALEQFGPDGKTTTALEAGEPFRLTLRPDVKTPVRVIARNAAAGQDASLEAATLDVTVTHIPVRPKPAPVVRLGVAPPAAPPASPGEPFVSDTPQVRVSAVVTSGEVKKLEWDDGDGKWVEAEYNPADPKSPTVHRDITVAEGGKPVTVRVRMTADGGSAREESVSVVWAGLPEVTVGDAAAVVQASELVLRGRVTATPKLATYEIRVFTESTEPRSVVTVRPDETGAWQGRIRLTPGENRIGVEVSNRWKRERVATRDVRFVRPPLVAQIDPISARGTGVGDVTAVVISPAELPPDRLTLSGRVTTVTPRRLPVRLCGLSVWQVTAASVPLLADGALPKSLNVVAGNADGDSPAVDVAVVAVPVRQPPPPPQITLTHGPDRTVLTSGENVRTDQSQVAIGVKVTAAVELTRAELRRPDAASGQPVRWPGVDAGAAVKVAGGFALEANVSVPLREGLNQFELVAATGGSSDTVTFSVSYTPPPIRVVLDTIEETVPEGSGAVTRVPIGRDPVRVTGGFVRVRGRVIWSGADDATRGAEHEVILIANEVRHLPIALAAPATGSREAAFEAPLFLNAKATQVRVEVCTRGRDGGLAQQKVADVAAEVHTGQPVRQQRLHLLVIAPQARDDVRSALAREVIAAVGGEHPAARPVFHRMPFQHKAFARATVYSPLIRNVSKPGVVSLLQDVEDEVRRSAEAAGPKGWVNDVVLVYYQGRDQIGSDGLLRLHTTRSIVYPDTRGEQFALRMDELPPTPGVRLLLLNVVDADGKPRPLDPLATVPLLMRYVWKDQDAIGRLLPLFHQATAQQPTVGKVADWVGDRVEQNTNRAYQPLITLPPTVRDRRLGEGGS